MKKGLLVILFFVVLGGGVFSYFNLFNEAEIKEAIVDIEPTKKEEVLLETKLQCRGFASSRKVQVQTKYTIPEVANYTEDELKEFAFYQVLHAFTNFQYNPLSSNLQYAQLRDKPNIRLDKVDHHPYGKEISGEVMPPDFLNLRKWNWPNKISKKSKALTVRYTASFDLDFCLKEATTDPSSVKFYIPVDPVYAYYTSSREHWTYRVLEPWGKTIPINLCQNLHGFYESDKLYASHFWRQWNPLKRGKETHTLHYECKDFLKEGRDYQSLDMVMSPLETDMVKPAIQRYDGGAVHVRVIKESFGESLNYYETSLEQIFQGRNFLSSLPGLTKEDFYLFRLVEGLNRYIGKAKLVEAKRLKESDFFKFKGFDKKMEFYIEVGKAFSKVDNCEIGLTYSQRAQTKKEFLNFDGCESEAFFIPLASQFAKFAKIKRGQARRYYLLGQPGLANASTGAYLLEYLTLNPLVDLSSYLNTYDKEEGFYIESSRSP